MTHLGFLETKLKELRETKHKLLQEQQDLIEYIKTKHTEAYDWMVENGVDLTDLKAQSNAIAAAVIISAATFTSNQDLHFQPDPKQEVMMSTPSQTMAADFKIIEPEELQGLSHEERTDLVWQRYGFLINESSRKYDIDAKLILATIMLESGGNTYAIRQEPAINDASYGLGQVLYGTARGIGFEGTPQELQDPKVGIDLIGKYHRRNLDVYGELTPEELTTAYNAGAPYHTPTPGHIAKFIKFYDLAKTV